MKDKTDKILYRWMDLKKREREGVAGSHHPHRMDKQVYILNLPNI